VGTITVGDKQFTVTQSSSSCVVILAPNGNLASGGTGSFGISIGDTTGQGLVSFSLTLSYDPAVVSFAGIDNAGTLASGFTVGANVVSPGSVRVAGFGTTPLTGGGTLIYLRFMAIGPIGSTSQVSFTAIQFNEGGCWQTFGTGSISIVGRSISGSVLYGTAPTPFGIAGVRVTASSGSTVFTDANGAYVVTNLGTGSVLLLPSLPALPSVNGITAADASLLLQAVLGIVTLTPDQGIAADVSGNGAITPFDAALIARFAVGLPNVVYTGSWRFSPPNRSYDSLPMDLTSQDFALILMGEVTGNWAPDGMLSDNLLLPTLDNDKQAQLYSSPKIDLSLPILTASQGTVTIPVSLNNYNGQIITAYQFDIDYDPSVLQPDDSPVDVTSTLSDGFGYEVNTSEPGRLRIAVYGATSIAGNGTLVNLRMNAVRSLRSRSELVLSSVLLNEGQPEATTYNGKLTVKR
jgi:hypothetical protein